MILLFFSRSFLFRFRSSVGAENQDSAPEINQVTQCVVDQSEGEKPTEYVCPRDLTVHAFAPVGMASKVRNFEKVNSIMKI